MMIQIYTNYWEDGKNKEGMNISIISGRDGKGPPTAV
jgi:hypothetical protein